MLYSEAMLAHKDEPIGRDAALKAVVWLKRNFGREIEEAVKGSAYSVDTICGIACQETAYFWVNMLERLTPEQVCARCVLDASGDAPGTVRRAFPRNTSAFRREYGDERTQMLIEEANKTRALRGYPHKNWVYKGYGIFQYDLQFVKVDPDFFFEKQWYNFSACLDRVMRELRYHMDATRKPFRGNSRVQWLRPRGSGLRAERGGLLRVRRGDHRDHACLTSYSV